MADDPLANLKLPYDYSKGDPDAPAPAAPSALAAPTIINPGSAPAPAPVVAAPPPAATGPTHPDVDKIKVPYDENQPSAPSMTSGGDSSGDSPLWTVLNKPLSNPSDYADAARAWGRGVYDTGRVWGNQAVVPHGLDRVLSYVSGTDYDTQAARTAAAEKDLGSFAEPVKWWGQNFSAQGIANRLAGGNGITSAIANNPLTTGIVTGGGGTLAGGDFDPVHVLKNAATTALESKAGQALGSAVSIGAGYLGQTGKALYQKAQDEAKAALDTADFPGWTAAIQKGLDVRKLQDLQTLYNKGGDVVGKAMDLANEATGAAKDAYQKIADAASKETGVNKWVDRAVTGGLGFLTGGETAGTLALGANEAANWINKKADVKSAIDQAFPNVVGYVKGVVNPQNWRNAVGNAAVVAGDDYEGLRNRVANFSPTGLIHNIPGASYLGY